MRGAIHPLPPLPFIALCSLKAQGQLYLYLVITIYVQALCMNQVYPVFPISMINEFIFI